MKKLYTLIPLLLLTLSISSCKDNDKSKIEDPVTDPRKITYYQDSDEDLYGNKDETKVLLKTEKQPEGYILKRKDGLFDCDDDNAEINPGQKEIFGDGIDNNCNEQEDECPDCTENEECIKAICTTKVTYYKDSDGDGYGDKDETKSTVEKPDGYILARKDGLFDCNDNDADINPAASDTSACGGFLQPACNFVDDNCDGGIDGDACEDCGDDEICVKGECMSKVTYYRDADHDGYGLESSTTIAGNYAPPGYSVKGAGDDNDCNDSNAKIHPYKTKPCGLFNVFSCPDEKNNCGISKK